MTHDYFIGGTSFPQKAIGDSRKEKGTPEEWRSNAACEVREAHRDFAGLSYSNKIGLLRRSTGCINAYAMAAISCIFWWYHENL